MDFKISHIGKPKISNPVLICGLPGIANVGKIAADFMIDATKARLFIEIHSRKFPHSVFVDEKSMIELPSIRLYHYRAKSRDIVFLAGDVQPIDEPSCYDFCEKILDMMVELGCKEIITLGGLGLNKIPKKPKVYVTGTDRQYMKSFPKCHLRPYGVVGPIIGVSGILAAMAKTRKMLSAVLLAQTLGHYAYLGIKGSKEIVAVLNARFGMKLDVRKLSEDIEEIEDELSLTLPEPVQKPKRGEISYFG